MTIALGALMPALAPDPADRPVSAERLLEAIAAVPVYAGWTDVSTADPTVIAAWQADPSARSVSVEIRARPRAGERIGERLPVIIAVVVALSMLLLLIASGSPRRSWSPARWSASCCRP